MRAPALIGLLPKSKYSAVDEARAIRLAAFATMGCKVMLPVYLGRKRLGYVVGDPENKRTLWFAGAANITALRAAIAGGQYTRSAFFKNNSAGGPSTVLWYDLWSEQGDPAPPSSPYGGTASTARALDNTVIGGIQHGPDVSTSYFKQIGLISASVSNIQTLLTIYDRVLQYDGNPYSTSTTTMTNTIPPPRYNTTGDGGMQIMMTVGLTGTGAGPVALAALGYTNDQGSAETVPIQTNQNTVAPNLTAFGTTFGAEIVCPYSGGSSNAVGPFICLSQNDLGVHNVTSLQFSATDGTNKCTLALVRPIAHIVIPNSGVFWETDYIAQIMNFEQVHDKAHISLLCYPGPAGNVYGSVEFVWS